MPKLPLNPKRTLTQIQLVNVDLKIIIKPIII